MIYIETPVKGKAVPPGGTAIYTLSVGQKNMVVVDQKMQEPEGSHH